MAARLGRTSAAFSPQFPGARPTGSSTSNGTRYFFTPQTQHTTSRVRLYENDPNQRFDVIYGAVTTYMTQMWVGGVQGPPGFFTEDFCETGVYPPPRANISRTYTFVPCVSPTPTSTPTLTPAPTPTATPTARATAIPRPRPSAPPRPIAPR